jgi:c-di-GMP-binding flagellar brake protein YcgR
MLQDKFQVGLRLSVQMNTSYNRIEMFLVGWIKDNVIFATGTDLQEVKLTSDDYCIVRFLKDGIAYGFHTQMVKKLYCPVPLIFFRYPEHVNSQAFRKSARVKTSIPAKIMGMTETRDLMRDNVRIADLSETGCLLEVAPEEELSGMGPGGETGCSSEAVSSGLSALEPGKDFYLTFMIWDESVELDCTIRSMRKHDGHYLLGVEFKHIPESCKESMQNFLGMLTISQRGFQL